MTGLNHSTLPVATGVLQHDVKRGEPQEARARRPRRAKPVGSTGPVLEVNSRRRESLPPVNDAVNAAPHPARRRPIPFGVRGVQCRRAAPPGVRPPSIRDCAAVPARGADWPASPDIPRWCGVSDRVRLDASETYRAVRAFDAPSNLDFIPSAVCATTDRTAAPPGQGGRSPLIA